MTVLTLQPDATLGKDTYITDAGTTSWNYGLSPIIQTAGGSPISKGLIRFALENIPPGSTINSATLTLECNAVGAATAANVEVHRALTQWNEGNANGANPTGAASTWARRDQVLAMTWSSGTLGGLAGTDYSSSAAATTSVAGTGTYTWDLTAEVDALVNGSIYSHGWWLIQPTGPTKNFVSSDDSSDSTKWPKLVIDYTPGATQVLFLQPDATTGIDTSLHGHSSLVNNNYGISTVIQTGNDGAWDKGLIKFDISALPANVTITSAIMVLHNNSNPSSPPSMGANRSLVQWFEGNKAGATLGASEDGSTWNLRNNNGSVAWVGGVGGAAGSDYASSATDSETINGPFDFFWDVTTDVQGFYAGTFTNHGWWLVTPNVGGTSSPFISSDTTLAGQHRPKLIILYTGGENIFAAIAGTSTITAVRKGVGILRTAIAGTSTVTAAGKTNEYLTATLSGTSFVTSNRRAKARMLGNSFGDSTVVPRIRANYRSVAVLGGTSSHVFHLKGVFRLSTGTNISGQGSIVAHILVKGQITTNIAGTSTVTAVGYARAIQVAAIIGCNPVPLLHITDGSVKSNGQLNILNFLNDRAGYFLVNYKPQIFQYKDGGYWSSSPQSQGRRLRGKQFENVIDIIEVAARASSQDNLIQYQQDLMAFQEAASDYWTSDFNFLPYYLVARAARETNTRYAMIHMISCPELENPFTQPFFDDAVGATFVSLTIRIEHGLWMSTPPGRFDCVEISGQREWTVSGWQAGS